jgi:outer membrane protein TolC
MTRIHPRAALVAAIGALAGIVRPAPLAAQQDTLRAPRPPASASARAARRLTLEDALRMAEAQSEAVQIARAGLLQARGQQYQARSQYLPQVSATGSYARTLRSQFQGLNFGGGGGDTSSAAATHSVCSPTISSGATQAERDAALAQAITCPAAGGGIDFSKVGFGAPNQWTLGLSVSQNVFAGGRIGGQNQAANASARAATIEVTAQRAQLALDVTQTYYDAALADRLVSIQEAALAQTEEVLRQTRVARQVGNQAEFDLLRAQVTRDNQVPLLLQVRTTRQVAYYRLKQLLDLPLDEAVGLATPLDDSTAVRGTVIAAVAAGSTNPMPANVDVVAPDTNVSDRAPVRQLEESVRAQQGLLRVARAERWPAVQLTTGYQRLYFPTTVFPQLDNARENWTIGVSASVPLFTGGRIKGSEMIAEGNLEMARARLQQTREFAALDARVALSALEQAVATWRASAGTAEQAARAYSIDQIRYREGISTQTDLSASRLLLEQSLANRAQAARDLAVARVKLALLKDLPLQAGGAGGQVQGQSQTQGAGATGGQGGGAQQQQPQQRTTTQAAASASGIGGGVTP